MYDLNPRLVLDQPYGKKQYSYELSVSKLFNFNLFVMEVRNHANSNITFRLQFWPVNGAAPKEVVYGYQMDTDDEAMDSAFAAGLQKLTGRTRHYTIDLKEMENMREKLNLVGKRREAAISRPSEVQYAGPIQPLLPQTGTGNKIIPTTNVCKIHFHYSFSLLFKLLELLPKLKRFWRYPRSQLRQLCRNRTLQVLRPLCTGLHLKRLKQVRIHC